MIDCASDRMSISKALQFLFSQPFQAQLSVVENPYGNGGASAAIVKVLEQQVLDDMLKKHFYDLLSP